MEIAYQDHRVEDHARVVGDEPLLEAEVAAEIQEEVNSPPPLEGEWLSLRRRKIAAIKITIVVGLILGSLMALSGEILDNYYIVVCNSIGVPLDACSSSNLANEEIAKLTSFGTMINSLLLLPLIPLVTGICERYGYKASFAYTSAILTVDVLCIYINWFIVPPTWTYWRLLSSDILEACGGGIIVFSNVALLSLFQLFPEPELRPRYVSLMTGILGVVGVVAPPLGAFVSRTFGTEILVLLCAAVLGCTTVYSLLMGDLPDFKYTQKTNVVDELGTKSKWQKTKAYVHKQMSGLSVLSFNHIADPMVRRTAFVLLFNKVVGGELAQSGTSTMMLFGKQHFGWDNKVISTVISISTLSMSFWGLLGFPLLQKWLSRVYEVNPLGVDPLDKRFLILGSAVRALGYAGFTVAQTSVQMITASAIKSQASMSGPTLMTALVKLIPSEDGAALMTASALLDSVCMVFIPTLMMQIYKVTLSWWPRLIFELDTAISLTLLLSLIFLIKIRPSGGALQV